MQCHVLGIALLPPIVAFWVATWRVTPAGPERRRLTWSGLGGVAIIALGYVPLLVSELGHDFAESRAALAFIASGGTGVTIALPIRLLFVGLRILAWPLTGLLTNGLVIGVVVGVTVVVGLAWRAGAGSGRERTAARWLLATLAFGWIVLTLGAAGLSTVTPLPVDHYHAFLDPVVFIALGMVVAAVWQGLQDRLRAAPPEPATEAASTDAAPTDAAATNLLSPTDDSTGSPAARPTPANVLRLALAGVVVGLGILIAWNVSVWPPAVAADGGWPAARVAADRIEAAAGDRSIQLIGLPAFKSTEAYGFPLERDGRRVVESIPLVPVPGGPVPQSRGNWRHDDSCATRCSSRTAADPPRPPPLRRSGRASSSSWIAGSPPRVGRSRSTCRDPDGRRRDRRRRWAKANAGPPSGPAFAIPETRTWREGSGSIGGGGQ